MIRHYRRPTRTRLCLYRIHLSIVINVYHQRNSHHHNPSNHLDKYRNCSNIKTIQTSQGLHQKYRILIQYTVSTPKYIIIWCYKHLNDNTPPFHIDFLAHLSSSAVLSPWGWFTEYFPKTKHENISNCKPKLNTYIPI